MVSLRSVTDVKERLEFLEEVVEKIYVKTLDKKANLVELDIRFKLPYWRLIDERHPVTKKLHLNPEKIRALRAAEGLA